MRRALTALLILSWVAVSGPKLGEGDFEGHRAFDSHRAAMISITAVVPADPHEDALPSATTLEYPLSVTSTNEPLQSDDPVTRKIIHIHKLQSVFRI